MTTGVFRGGILACDSLVTCRGMRHGEANKIFDLGDIIGCAAGTLSISERIKNFLETGEYDEDFLNKDENGFEALIIERSTHRVMTYTDKEPEIYDAPFYVIGSGSEIALGALEMGASAEQAVQAACKYDCRSGGIVNTMKVW